jgi:hypothetical protein
MSSTDNSQKKPIGFSPEELEHPERLLQLKIKCGGCDQIVDRTEILDYLNGVKTLNQLWLMEIKFFIMRRVCITRCSAIRLKWLCRTIHTLISRKLHVCTPRFGYEGLDSRSGQTNQKIAMIDQKYSPRSLGS